MLNRLHALTSIQRETTYVALELLLLGAVICAPLAAWPLIISVSFMLGAMLRQSSAAQITAALSSHPKNRARF